jgi:Replication-relaxation
MGEKMRGTLRPDAELILLAPVGPVDLLLEWDRGTETLQRLEEKLRRYRTAERKLYDYPGPRSILVVVPGRRRLDNLRELFTELSEGGWPILATTATELRAAGPLARIWQRLDADQASCSLTELPVRRNLSGGPRDPANALGRRWCHQDPGFWERLSPLGRAPAEADLRPSGIDGYMDDPEPD